MVALATLRGTWATAQFNDGRTSKSIPWTTSRVPIVRAGKLAAVGQACAASHNRQHLPRHFAKKRGQRSAMVSPAIHTLGRDTTMHLCSYQLCFQTPAFLGNAQQQGQWRQHLRTSMHKSVSKSWRYCGTAWHSPVASVNYPPNWVRAMPT